MRDGQTEPGTVLLALGRVEGGENVGAGLGRDAGATVGKGDLDLAPDPPHPHSDLALAAQGHGIHAVLEQVDEHLLQLHAVAPDRGKPVGNLFFQLDTV